MILIPSLGQVRIFQRRSTMLYYAQLVPTAILREREPADEMIEVPLPPARYAIPAPAGAAAAAPPADGAGAAKPDPEPERVPAVLVAHTGECHVGELDLAAQLGVLVPAARITTVHGRGGSPSGRAGGRQGERERGVLAASGAERERQTDSEGERERDRGACSRSSKRPIEAASQV